MEIVNMTALTEAQRRQAAQVLSDSLPVWLCTPEAAWAELQGLIIPRNTMLAAVQDGEVVGMGGILAPTYDGRVFELHPLAVKASHRRMGVARAIVRALEDTARARGGVTLWLGADDERPGGETSLANADLYDDLPQRLAAFDPGTHQSAFYLRIGFTVIGVMPDANGPGKPDIYFGKRL